MSITLPDLSSLSTRELEALYRDIEGYENYRRSSPISFYLPNDSGQEPFHRSPARIRILLGGNRGGKTTAGGCEAIAHSLGFRPWLEESDPFYRVLNAEGDPIAVPNVGTVLGESYKVSIERAIWPTLSEWLPPGLISKIGRSQQGAVDKIVYSNGSSVNFMTYNQNPKEFEAFKAHWSWYDEPPPHPIFVANERSLVDYSGRSWFTLTPVRQPWIWEDLVGNADESDTVDVFTMSAWDNPHVPRASLEHYFSSIKDPDERRSRELGVFLHLQGRVFPMWEARPPYYVPYFEPKRDWVRVCGIDPHPRKPVAVLWAAISPVSDFWYVYRELYDDTLGSVKKVTSRIHELERGEGRKDPFRIIDPSALENELTSESSVYEQFANEDIFCELAGRWDKDGRIRLTRDMFAIDPVYKRPRIVVMDSCRRLKFELMNYIYDDWAARLRDEKDPKPEVVKKDDDLIDCLMYLVQYGQDARDFSPELSNSRPDVEQSEHSSRVVRPSRENLWS
jgi:phage terminase large subunit-like protein